MIIIERGAVMDWQPGPDDAEGAYPDRDPGPPSPGSGADPGARSGPGGAGPGSGAAGRDPRLAAFARDDVRGPLLPSGLLALIADQVAGPQRRCPGATDDEVTGLMQVFAATESWAAASKLGMARELIRRDGPPSPGSDHGDLPETWSPSLRHELAAALACSARSADAIAWLAWELAARLPGIGARLEDGTLTQAKAKAVAETLGQLTDADAARAEAMIIDQLAGKTYPQVLRLAEQAALTVDPALAERRREHAQKHNARVSFFREQAGTAAISGRDLPPDEALTAMAAVNARAEEYQESEAFEGTPMDVLRAYAYLDLINGAPAAERIAAAERQDDAADAAASLARAQARAAERAAAGTGTRPDADPGPGAVHPDPPDRSDPGAAGSDIPADPDDCPCTDCDGSCLVDLDLDLDEDDDPGDGDPDDGPGSRGPGPSGPGDGSPDPGGAPPTGQARQRRPADLIVPLATLLGLAERPGEIHGFGLLDPALARQLAAAATASPRTTVCVTVTNPQGYAIGHGCARPTRTSPSHHPAGPSPAALPARLNLTIPATTLTTLPRQTSHSDTASHHSPEGHNGPWAFTPRGRPGSPTPPRGSPGTPGAPPDGQAPPDYFGAWTLRLPDGRSFTVRLEQVPTFSCDHRYESHGYQPSDRLRHLVQIRDGTCTFPPCNRHARESDFEHAIPYDQGGKTCTCNAGARSRACHRIKQTPGWKVTQPRPGWHRWETPSGRVYEQEPKRYPA